ncbi:(d)CMP kinase [Paraliobacillus sp. JSM ZJ581]|uniref:(d)CMP kinase n=1 Tax=Paraliobacillus sp. JSM ZJ581 TaxID=3342118 RepID=UPI0035A9430B
MKNNKIAIAIDGPAAAGKSTVAKKVAYQLDYIYIDTGAMYRALTYKALRHNIPLSDGDKLFELIKTSTIRLQQVNNKQMVLIDEEDVTDAVRGEDVTNHVSVVAQHRLVREEMVKQQKQLAAKRGVVMDGRDIGTHVIPDAEVKIFLIASVEERAIRRHDENVSKGFTSDLEKLKVEIANRDKLDSEREVSPLIRAEDAIEIDTTSLSIEEVTHKILTIVSNTKE